MITQKTTKYIEINISIINVANLSKSEEVTTAFNRNKSNEFKTADDLFKDSDL